MNKSAVFSSYYLAPIEFYHYLTLYPEIQIDIHESFVKQTYRSRTYILGPNGIQVLPIPLINVKKRKPFKDVKISYSEDWQKIHWKSIEAAYRRSPYFEYYEDHFYGFYHKEYNSLLDFNTQLQTKIIELIGLDLNITYSNEYIENDENIDDFRTSFSPKVATQLKFTPYIQVFDDRNEFAPNLSILDLLFNEGPNTLNYLKSISK